MKWTFANIVSTVTEILDYRLYATYNHEHIYLCLSNTFIISSSMKVNVLNEKKEVTSHMGHNGTRYPFTGSKVQMLVLSCLETRTELCK